MKNIIVHNEISVNFPKNFIFISFSDLRSVKKTFFLNKLFHLLKNASKDSCD